MTEWTSFPKIVFWNKENTEFKSIKVFSLIIEISFFLFDLYFVNIV